MTRDLPDRRQGWLRHIYQDSQRVMKIVVDLSSASRSRSDKMAVDTAPVDVGALLATIKDELQESSNAHRLRLNVQPSLPPVTADAARMRQAMLHLGNNAINYSPNGGDVTIRASASPPTNSAPCSPRFNDSATPTPSPFADRVLGCTS
jgi:signal transduction histidine kinase